MTEFNRYAQAGAQLGDILRARGLPLDTSLDAFATNADPATASFLHDLPGYPYSPAIAAEQFGFMLMYAKTTSTRQDQTIS